jgi:phosphotransferase system  glucose/maltose/N-acetylglucosamine-specific IIC component
VAIERIGERAGRSGVAILVAAGIVYEIIAAACSSPQTTEINAKVRADTLMKWVWIGTAQAALFIAIAMYFDKERRTEYAIGGTLAILIMLFSYTHALHSGLDSEEPGTEEAHEKLENAFPLFAYSGG